MMALYGKNVLPKASNNYALETIPTDGGNHTHQALAYYGSDLTSQNHILYANKFIGYSELHQNGPIIQEMYLRL